jgi:hypothetical protein
MWLRREFHFPELFNLHDGLITVRRFQITHNLRPGRAGRVDRRMNPGLIGHWRDIQYTWMRVWFVPWFIVSSRDCYGITPAFRVQVVDATAWKDGWIEKKHDGEYGQRTACLDPYGKLNAQ